MTARTAFALVVTLALLLATTACAGSATPTLTASPDAATPTGPAEIPTSSPKPTATLAPVPTVPLVSLTLADFPRLDGSTATIPLGIALLKALTGCSDAQAEARVTYTTTDPSYHALAEGKADLLLVYPPAKPTVDMLDVFHTMDVREIGRDALVFIVNEDNPVDGLTSEQVREIYSGAIVNWKQVGGSDQPIVAFQRPTESGSQTLMLDLMMKDTVLMQAPTERIAETMADVIDAIAAFSGSANAIGYLVYYYAKNMYTQPGLKFLAVDGVLPSNGSISAKAYGFTSPFYGVIPLRPTAQAKTVLDWLLTDDGQRLHAAAGYVPVRPVD